MILLPLVLFTTFSVTRTAEQWIDPHDMNTNAKQNLKIVIPEDVDSKKEHDKVNNVVENYSIIHLKRFINLLINSADIDKSKSNIYEGKLRFSLDTEGFKFLKDFSNTETVTEDKLRKLDSILSNMFYVKTYFDDIADVFLSSQEKVVQFLFSQNSLPLLGLSLLFYVAYNLFRSNFSIWYVARYSIFIIILIDFVQRYQQLYQEAVDHNMHVEYSAKCDTTKMSWKEYLKYIAGHQDCEKKVVSLLEVGLFQIRSVIIIPLSAAGVGMGQFGAGLWNNLPFPWNILIFPLMLIFCAILTIIIMSSVNGRPFKFNLMHLLHLEFGDNKINNRTLDKLLDAVNHRPFLEVVRGRDNERTPPKRKNTPKPIKNKNYPPLKKNSFKKSSSDSKIKFEQTTIAPNETDKSNQVGNPVDSSQ